MFEIVVSMLAGGVDVNTKMQVKYLEVTLDNKLNYKSHIKKASERIIKLVTFVSLLMANVKGISSNKRRLLISNTHSIMFYGA